MVKSIFTPADEFAFWQQSESTKAKVFKESFASIEQSWKELAATDLGSLKDVINLTIDALDHV